MGEVVWPNRRAIPSRSLKLGKTMQPSVSTALVATDIRD
jgi:hypothetical protein